MESIVFTENLSNLNQETSAPTSNQFTSINIDGPDVKCECKVKVTDCMNRYMDTQGLSGLNFYLNLWFANLLINICCFFILWSLLYNLCKNLPYSCLYTVIILFVISLVYSNNIF